MKIMKGWLTAFIPGLKIYKIQYTLGNVKNAHKQMNQFFLFVQECCRETFHSDCSEMDKTPFSSKIDLNH